MSLPNAITLKKVMNTSQETITVKPILKWAGGKTGLIPQILPFFPNFKEKNINSYIEPFLGGGALFFYLQAIHDFDNIILIDNNPSLINLYKVVRGKIDYLIESLHKIENNYKNIENEQEKQAFYYNIRALFNETILNHSFCDITQATYFMFLNRTCFNGLFRVNQKKLFNVPFGRYKNPRILDENGLKKASEALQKATILQGDFSLAKNYASNRSFIYYDPPYKPLNVTSHFNKYSDDFGDQDQTQLCEFFKELDKKNVFQLLSNSDTFQEGNNMFFDDLYQDFFIERLFAKRMINSNPDKRGCVSEILVRNYHV